MSKTAKPKYCTGDLVRIVKEPWNQHAGDMVILTGVAHADDQTVYEFIIPERRGSVSETMIEGKMAHISTYGQAAKADTPVERPAPMEEIPGSVVDDCVQTIIADCLSGIEMEYLDSRVRARLHILMSLQRKWISKYAKVEAERPAEDWISVEDRLPEIVNEFGGRDNKMYGSSVPVLIVNKGIVEIGEFYKSGNWAMSEGSGLRQVTHWRPLPAPPSEHAPLPPKSAAPRKRQSITGPCGICGSDEICEHDQFFAGAATLEKK